MPVDHFPDARWRRIVGHAFIYERGGAVRQRAIDDIAVAGDPADVGRAPVNVAGPIVETEFVRQARPEQIAAGRVQHALGLAGRSRRIEDEQRVFGIHRFGRAIGRDVRGFLMQPKVATGRHGHSAAGGLHDHDFLHTGAILQRGIDIGLERHRLARATTLVSGHDQAGIAIDDAPGQRFGGKSAEHDAVNRADPGAGEQGEGGFGDHRQIEGDAVALPGASGFEHIGQAAHLFMHLCIAVAARLRIRRIGFPDDRGLIAARRQMAVDAVGADVQHAVGEPFDAKVGLGKAAFIGAGRRRDPVEPLRPFQPIGVGIVNRAGIIGSARGLVHQRILGPIFRHREKIIRHRAPLP